LDDAHIVLAPRVPLFMAGDEARCLFVVRTGYLKLVASRGTQQMVVQIAGPCSFLGLSAALFHRNHDLSAESLTQTQLWPIDRSALLSLMGKSEYVRKCILYAVCIESHILSEDVRRIGLNATAASRLGSLLVDLSRELGEAVEGRIRFPLLAKP
jgi:CRP-like cAMP-binding protein